jgi:hypothetical protein
VSLDELVAGTGDGLCLFQNSKTSLAQSATSVSVIQRALEAILQSKCRFRGDRGQYCNHP